MTAVRPHVWHLSSDQNMLVLLLIALARCGGLNGSWQAAWRGWWSSGDDDARQEDPRMETGRATGNETALGMCKALLCMCTMWL